MNSLRFSLEAKKAPFTDASLSQFFYAVGRSKNAAQHGFLHGGSGSDAKGDFYIFLKVHEREKSWSRYYIYFDRLYGEKETLDFTIVFASGKHGQVKKNMSRLQQLILEENETWSNEVPVSATVSSNRVKKA